MCCLDMLMMMGFDYAGNDGFMAWTKLPRYDHASHFGYPVEKE
jgi:hypothetical protein